MLSFRLDEPNNHQPSGNKLLAVSRLRALASSGRISSLGKCCPTRYWYTSDRERPIREATSGAVNPAFCMSANRCAANSLFRPGVLGPGPVLFLPMVPPPAEPDSLWDHGPIGRPKTLAIGRSVVPLPIHYLIERTEGIYRRHPCFCAGASDRKPPTFSRTVLRLHGECWLETVRHFGRWFKRAAGGRESLAIAAMRCGRRWFQGQSAARIAFQ